MPQFMESRRSTPAIPPGLENEVASRRGTPTIPPGFSKPPTALPDLEGIGSRPSSRSSLRRAASGHVVPALPLRPGTPGGSAAGSRTASRAASPAKKDEDEVVHETPTRKSKGTTSKVLDQPSAPPNVESEGKRQSPEVKEDEKAAKPGPIKAPRSVADVVKSAKENKPSNAEAKGAQASTAAQQVAAKSQAGKASDEKTVESSEPEPAKDQARGQNEESKPTPTTPAKTESKKRCNKAKAPRKTGHLSCSGEANPSSEHECCLDCFSCGSWSLQQAKSDSLTGNVRAIGPSEPQCQRFVSGCEERA
ncbi:hypothetical protein L1887_56403 [Cichorium endivia]|nr:hypothetical protein L1887_56403 [Cichorium endivia]